MMFNNNYGVAYKYLIFFTWIYVQNESVSAQRVEQDRNVCRTPNQRAGRCININNCTPLLKLLMNQSSDPQVRAFLKASACGYEGQSPKVCCPIGTHEAIRQNDSDIGSNATRKSNLLPKSPNCGFSNVTIPRIVNGVPAKLGEFPWIVALGYRNPRNPEQPKWLCGGSLITNKHVLTAAHCVQNRRDLYLARLGDLDLYSDDDGATPVTIKFQKAKIHENYNAARYTNDIAILTLEKSANNPTIWPICLPVTEPFRSMSYLNFSPRVAGWGSISFKGPSSSTLQQIFLNVMQNQMCERVFGRSAIIDEKILCAGSSNGDKDACGGDSGGPLMHEISEGASYRVYQIGIVSYGFKCAEPGYPGVYTRVTAFVDWIQNNLD